MPVFERAEFILDNWHRRFSYILIDMIEATTKVT